MKRLKIISDSEYGHWRDRLDLPTTREQDDACLALERFGKRFLVDFGYENAQSVLATEMDKRLEEVSPLIQ